MIPRLKELYKKEIVTGLKEKFNFKNSYMTPKLKKVVINMGLGLDGNDNKIVKIKWRRFGKNCRPKTSNN